MIEVIFLSEERGTTILMFLPFELAKFANSIISEWPSDAVAYVACFTPFDSELNPIKLWSLSNALDLCFAVLFDICPAGL